MNSISFETTDGKAHTLKAPSLWNEVSPKQLLLWIAVLYSRLSDEVKLSYAVPIFYNIRMGLYVHLKPHQRLQIAPSLRHLLKENKLNKWAIPTFRHWLIKYYGPTDKLSNLTAHEFFNICEPLYWKFKKDGDVRALNALCAVLYRRKRRGLVDDDIRADYTDAGTARRARRFRSLNLYFKLAIAFNYEGCRNFIAANHAKAFEGKGGSGNKRSDVTLALAGGPLGDLTATKKTNLYTFLLHLVNLIEQEEKLKK